MSETPDSAARNVVLVHGGFVDGSGWEGVYRALRRDGFAVSVVQNPTISLADDVDATRRVLAAQDGPVILVGHSYGGAVITEAGNDPKVVGLVYIAGWIPDKGESVSSSSKTLSRRSSGSPPSCHLRTVFSCWTGPSSRRPFAGDVDPSLPRSWRTLKFPGALQAVSATISEPAWRRSRLGLWWPPRTG